MYMYAINTLLAFGAFFGGIVIKGLLTSVTELRKANEALHEKLANYVSRDEFRDLRTEQRALFDKMFDKMDELRGQIANKADRHEVRS